MMYICKDCDYVGTEYREDSRDSMSQQIEYRCPNCYGILLDEDELDEQFKNIMRMSLNFKQARGK